MRRVLFGQETPSFRKALDSLWKLGIPVLPIPSKGGFHGACYRFEGRPAIAVKQTLRSPARWLFDLTHELGHLAEDKDPRLMVIEAEGPAAQQDLEAERRAHDFAAKALLGPSCEDIFLEVWNRAGGQAARLKKVTLSLATELHLDVGLVAQHVALRRVREASSIGGALPGISNVQQKIHSRRHETFFSCTSILMTWWSRRAVCCCRS
jgi:Zn-dependent peptidase ImmA (M78 family)